MNDVTYHNRLDHSGSIEEVVTSFARNFPRKFILKLFWCNFFCDDWSSILFCTSMRKHQHKNVFALLQGDSDNSDDSEHSDTEVATTTTRAPQATDRPLAPTDNSDGAADDSVFVSVKNKSKRRQQQQPQQQPQPQDRSRWRTLLPQLIIDIVIQCHSNNYAHLHSYISAVLVCREWYNVLNSEMFWREMVAVSGATLPPSQNSPLIIDNTSGHMKANPVKRTFVLWARKQRLQQMKKWTGPSNDHAAKDSRRPRSNRGRWPSDEWEDRF